MRRAISSSVRARPTITLTTVFGSRIARRSSSAQALAHVREVDLAELALGADDAAEDGGVGHDYLASGCPVNGTCRSPAAFALARSPRRSYRLVVAGLACPAIPCTVAMSAPASSMSPMNVRRMSCGENDETFACSANRATSC